MSNFVAQTATPAEWTPLQKYGPSYFGAGAVTMNSSRSARPCDVRPAARFSGISDWPELFIPFTFVRGSVTSWPLAMRSVTWLGVSFPMSAV